MRPSSDVDTRQFKRSQVLPAFPRFREDEEEIVEEVHVLDMPTDEEMNALRSAMFWHPYSDLAVSRHTNLPYVFKKEEGGQPVLTVFAVRKKGEGRMLDRWLRENGSRSLRVVSSKVISHEEATRRVDQLESETWRARIQLAPPPGRNPSIPPGAPWRPLGERTREERTDGRYASPIIPERSIMHPFNMDTGVAMTPESVFGRPLPQEEERRRSVETEPPLRSLTVEERRKELAEWARWELQRRENWRRTEEEIERLRAEQAERERAEINRR